MKVLIIDDEIAAGSALKKVLELRSMTVNLATSLAGGLVEVAAFAPNVVILDAELADSSGFETMKAIPQIPCPVVIYSAFDEEELAIAAFKNGAADFICKNGDANIPQRVMWAHFRNIYERRT